MGMNILGLIIGTLQAKLLLRKSSKDEIIKNTQIFYDWINCKKLIIRRIYNFLIIISLIGVLLTYINLFSQVSISQFFTQQQFVKTHVERSNIATYLSLAAYCALPISVSLDHIARKHINSSIIPLIFTTMYSLSYWGRFPLLMAVVIFLTSKMLFFILDKQSRDFLKYKRGTLLKLFFYGLIIFLIIFLFMSWTIELRVSEYGDAYDPYADYYVENTITKFLKSNSHIFGSFRAITLTYGYFVASLPTLNYWVSMDSEYALGQASFPYIFRLLDRMNLIHKPLIVGDRVVGRGMQLPSLVGYLYIDFGWLGVLIISYIIGFIATMLYEKFLKRPNIGLLMFLTLMYALIIFSPMTNVVSQTLYPIILFGFFIINNILKKKP